MRFPEFLKANGTIGFVSPAFSCGIEPYKSAFNNSLKKWQSMGYKTVLGANTYAVNGIGISNSPKACAEELVAGYTDNNSDVLISCGGGELMCEILPYIDFEAIKSAPAKWYLGYSDNTHFTFLLATLCDVASIYGPCASSFGMEPWHEAIRDCYDILTGATYYAHNYFKYEKESLKSETNPLAPYNCTENVKIKAYSDSLNEIDSLNMEGRLIGGCMDCLVNILGTKFDKVGEFVEKYKEDGIIWYLEACDLNVFSIRRAMWQMQQAGWFKYTKGFIFGRPLNGDDMMNLNAVDAVSKVASELQVPIIVNADIGHLPPAMPIINGAFARVYFTGSFPAPYELMLEYEMR